MPKAKANDHRDYVARRKAALIEADMTQQDLIVRWAEKFGSCSSSLVSQIVLGTTRSHDKEVDFAEIVGKSHGFLFSVPRDEILPPGRNEVK